MKVSFVKTPFARPTFEVWQEFSSIAEIARHHDCSFDKSEIYLDSVKIDSQYWEDVKPKQDSHLVIVQVPGEVATWIAVASLVLAAGTAIYAYTQYESPPDGPSQGERRNRITGASNGIEKYSGVPVVFGRHKITPPYAARTYREFIGDEEYLNVMFCLGHGPMKVHEDTIKIGETSIDNFEDVSYQILDHYENTSEASLRRTWAGDVVDLDPAVELESDNLTGYTSADRPGSPTVRTVREGTDIIQVDWNWPEGAMEISGSKGKQGWSSSVECYLLKGDQKYIVVRYGGGCDAAASSVIRNSHGDILVVNSLNNTTGHCSFTNYTENGWVYEVQPENRVAILGPFTITDKNNINVNFSENFIASRSVWYTTDETRRGLRFRNPFPEESLDVYCRQIYGQEKLGTSRDHQGRIDWVGLQGITNLSPNEFSSLIGGDKTPLRVNGSAVKNFRPVIMTMRIRASSQLSGNLDNVSMEVESVVPSDWNSDWRDWSNRSLKTTNNPAELFRWLLQGPMNNSPMPNEKLDMGSLSDWRNTCFNEGWETSYLLNEEVTLQEQLNNVAFTGRAELTSWSGRFGVVENVEQDIPVQVFSPKNSWDFGMNREFPEQVDGIKYEFENAKRDYEQDEQEYVDPELSTNDLQGKFNGVELWGVTDPELATRHARFMHFEQKLRRFEYKLTTDLEGLIPRRGQMVSINNDVIDVGLGSGYIVDQDSDNFKIDETINLEEGVEYRLQHRPFVGDIEEFNTIYLGDGWFQKPVGVSFQIEEFVLYGEPSFESVDCIVKNIGFDEDYNATLNLVNAAQQVYDIDSGEIPQIESILTPKEAEIEPLPPELSISNEPYNFSNNTIHVKARAKQQSGVTVDRYVLEFRDFQEINPREVIEEEDATDYLATTTNGSEIVETISIPEFEGFPPSEDFETLEEIFTSGDQVIFGNDNAKVYTVDSVTSNYEMILTEPFEGEDGEEVRFIRVGAEPVEDNDWSQAGVSNSGDFYVPFDQGLGSTVRFRARAVSSYNLNSARSDVKEITLSRLPSEAVENTIIEEKTNTPRTPDAMYSTIEIRIEEPDDPLFASAIVEYRVQGQSSWDFIGEIGSQFENYQEQQVFSNGITYEFRVRSVSIFGVESREGPVRVIKTSNVEDPNLEDPDPSSFIRVPNVTGLEIYEQGNDNVFKGRDVQFEWRKSTIEDWIEVGQEGKLGASAAKLDQYFRDYQVEIWANNRRVHKDWVEDAKYTYTYEQNAEDYEREEGEVGAYRNFQIRVYERGRNNQISKKPARLSVENPPITAVNALEIDAGFNVIEVSYEKPDERDFAGVDIWVSDTAGISEDDPVTKTTSDNSVSITRMVKEDPESTIEQGEDYYVRIRPFDVFGRIGSPLSSEFLVTTRESVDTGSLSEWAFRIEPVDEQFMSDNLTGEAVPSEKIKNLTAAKLDAGIINALGPITTASIFQSVPRGELQDPGSTESKVGMGVKEIENDFYTFWSIDSLGTLSFGINETGDVFFRGNIENNNLTISKEGEISAPNLTIGVDGSFTTPNFTIDDQGNVNMAGNLDAATGTFTGTLQGVDGEFSGDVTASNIKSNKTHIDDTVSGYFLSQQGELHVGDADSFMKFDSSGFEVNGATMKQGRIESQDGNFVIDLNNKFISIEV